MASGLLANKLKNVKPAEVGLDKTKLENVDNIIEQAIERGEIPGAVLLVMRNNKVAYKKAFGHRQLIPKKLKMTTETIFDVASLTKPVATGSAMMVLLERGEIRLLDKVNHYFPNFKAWQDTVTGEKKDIRLIHLLTHTSGLPAYAHPTLLQKLYGNTEKETLFKHIEEVERFAKPATAFKYSGLNFMTMQRLVEKVSGQPLNKFCQENIFKPLQMHNTRHVLSNKQKENCATTEVLENGPLVGTVHDPMARVVMNGLSANAGLFSTADDLAIYSAMLLNNGTWQGTQIFSPLIVKAFRSIPRGYEKFGRGLTWDLESDYASNQGDLLSAEAYGHTGYTGTSIVIDPVYNLSIVFLTNRVHPNDKGRVVRLRSLVANGVASSIIK